MNNLFKQSKMIDKHISIFFKKLFGIRTVKTGIATALALYIATQVDLRMPIMAGLSAIVTMKTSIFDAIKTSRDRMLSTIVGVLIGGLFQQLGFIGFLPMVLGIIIVINICNIFKWKDSTTLAIMVYVMVMLYRPSGPDYMSFWSYGLHRLFDTFVGLVIGVLINYFVLPPNRSEFIVMTYRKSIKEMENALVDILKGEKYDLANLMNDINSINNELDYIRKDSKMGAKSIFKISQLVRINSKFYSGMGIIAQFAEDGRIPILSKTNKEGLNHYFDTNVEVDTENFPEEFESAFNYYLDDLLLIMEELRKSVKELSDILDQHENPNQKESA